MTNAMKYQIHYQAPDGRWLHAGWSSGTTAREAKQKFASDPANQVYDQIKIRARKEQ